MRLLLCCGLLVLSSAAFADKYQRCTDSQGRVFYMTDGCPDSRYTYLGPKPDIVKKPASDLKDLNSRAGDLRPLLGTAAKPARSGRASDQAAPSSPLMDQLSDLRDMNFDNCGAQTLAAGKKTPHCQP